MKFIDLSGEIFDGQPGHFRVTVRDFLTHADTAPRMEPPAQGYTAKLLMLADHTGTHVDAPAHFYPGAATIDQMPLEMFSGEALVADCTWAAGNAGPLDVDTFMQSLARDGLTLRPGDIVLLQLMADGQDVFCGLSAAMSQYLVDQRVKLVGVDRGTPDCPMIKDKPAHVKLLGAQIPIVEGLRNLDQVKGRRFQFLGLPLKIAGASGSPIRAVAIQDWA